MPTKHKYMLKMFVKHFEQFLDYSCINWCLPKRKQDEFLITEDECSNWTKDHEKVVLRWYNEYKLSLKGGDKEVDKSVDKEVIK
jgi:hypothetical protein